MIRFTWLYCKAWGSSVMKPSQTAYLQNPHHWELLWNTVLWCKTFAIPFFITPNAMVMNSEVFHVWKYAAFIYWYHKSANSHSKFFLILWKPLRCPMTCITNQSLPVWPQSSTTSTEDKHPSSLYSSLTSAVCSFCCVEDSIFQCQW